MTTRAATANASDAAPYTRAALWAFFGLGMVLTAWRLVAGLGATTGMNDGYPFGLWIALDVVTGTALACGGYAVAILGYVLNRGRYHPLVRPALLASALGYSMAGIGVFLDVGRWWMLWKVPLYFWHWNLNSALLEVALCVMAYTVVLWIELAPAFLEKWQDTAGPILRSVSRHALTILKRTSIWIIALGLLLPTMHQSSLGTMMLLAGSRLHPLWRTPLVPLLCLVSCVGMGYAVVVVESAMQAAVFKRPIDLGMLASLAAAIVPLQVVFVVLRLADLAWRGNLGLFFSGDPRGVIAAFEFVLFLAPVVMLASPERRHDLGHLFRAALAMLLAGAVYRFDLYLVAFMPGGHWSYFPTVSELFIAVGLIVTEVIVYLEIVKRFPNLAGHQPLSERQAAQ